MHRREFVALLGSVAMAWPLRVTAQQQRVPVIGFLSSASRDSDLFRPIPFQHGLKETGYVEGQNVTVEYRFAENQYDRLPALATDLIRLHAAVIVASGDDKVVQAVRKARAAIPIVSAFDPEERAFANRDGPADNFTRVAVFSTALTSKRLEVLRDLLPNVSVVGFIVNPRNPNAASDIKEIQEAGQKLGPQIIVINAADERDFAAAFAELARQRTGAITMQADALFNAAKNQLVFLAKQHAMPVIYTRREFVEAGGLISYGSNLTRVYRQVGIYTGQALKGSAKPGQLRIVFPTNFELAVNGKTAKALGLEIPPALLARADEVIE